MSILDHNADLSNEEILARIEAWQKCDYVHPMTCGEDSKHPPLVGKLGDRGRVVLVCPECGTVQHYVPRLPTVEGIRVHQEAMHKLWNRDGSS